MDAAARSVRRRQDEAGAPLLRSACRRSAARGDFSRCKFPNGFQKASAERIDLHHSRSYFMVVAGSIGCYFIIEPFLTAIRHRGRFSPSSHGRSSTSCAAFVRRAAPRRCPRSVMVFLLIIVLVLIPLELPARRARLSRCLAGCSAVSRAWLKRAAARFSRPSQSIPVMRAIGFTDELRFSHRLRSRFATHHADAFSSRFRHVGA